MNDIHALLEAVHASGVTIRVDGSDLRIKPAGVLPEDLKAQIRERKPDIVRLLNPRAIPTIEECREMPLSEVARRRVSLRIESDNFGTFWLVPTEADREPGPDPSYSVAEAHMILGIPEALVRQIHAFKRVFGVGIRLPPVFFSINVIESALLRQMVQELADLIAKQQHGYQ